jgi:hypothetical protein
MSKPGADPKHEERSMAEPVDQAIAQAEAKAEGQTAAIPLNVRIASSRRSFVLPPIIVPIDLTHEEAACLAREVLQKRRETGNGKVIELPGRGLVRLG